MGVKARDQLEFGDFFRAESDRLLRMCWAVTLDRELARDVAQETLTRAWKEWDRIAPIRTDPGGSPAASNPAAWCQTVAINIIRSHSRRERTAAAAVLHPPGPVELGIADLDLIAALAQLSDRQREAIVLHHLLDLPVACCAQRMDLGESTVKEHLQRGRAHLERELGNHLIETREA